MAKIKKAQYGVGSLSKLAQVAKKRLDNYSGKELSPEQKKYYAEIINKKASQAEADRKAKPKGYKSGGKVVKKAAKAKYGAKKKK